MRIEKEDIDPSDFTEEELRDIIFGAAVCGKAMEKLSEDEFSLRQAYNIIEHIDGLSHERMPSDLIQEQALNNSEQNSDDSEDEKDWNDVIRELSEMQ